VERFRRTDLSLAANGPWRYKRMASSIHTQAVFGTRTDEGFGINASGLVVMQVRALGHTPQKRFEVQGIRSRGLIGAGSALFGCARRRCCWFFIGRSLREDKHWQKQEKRCPCRA
jgi:hypothetical protein